MNKKFLSIFSLSLWILALLILVDLFILILPSAVELVVRRNFFWLILMIGTIPLLIFFTLKIYQQPIFFIGGLLAGLLIVAFGIQAINGADGNCKTFFNPVVLRVTKLNVKTFPKLFPTLQRRLGDDYMDRCKELGRY